MYINEMSETGGINTSRGIVYDGKGRGKVYAKAGAAITAGTVYALSYDEDGREAVAVGTSKTGMMVGVAEKSLASGEYGWFVVEGEIDITTPSITTTAGHAAQFHASTGAIEDSGAAFSGGADEFGVFTSTDSTAGTTHSVYMIPREITF